MLSNNEKKISKHNQAHKMVALSTFISNESTEKWAVYYSFNWKDARILSQHNWVWLKNIIDNVVRPELHLSNPKKT